jgi:hypothetical protein
MPITVVTTMRIDREVGLRLVKQGAPILKQHGATAVRYGYCHSGARTGSVSVVLTYPDWQTYGKAAHGLSDDKAYQAILAEVTKVGEIVDRSIMVIQDV